MQGFTEDSEGLGLDPFTRERIDEETKKLYRVAKDLKENTKDSAKIPLTLNMLEETECILNDYLDCFKQYAIDEGEILQ